MNRKTFLKAAAAAPLVALVPSPSFAEGAAAPVILPYETVPIRWGLGVVPIGFANAIKGYEYLYPTLAASLASTAGRGPVRAISTTISWERAGRTEKNFMQISRTPFGITGTQMSRVDYGAAGINKLRLQQLHQHLQGIELTLRQGKPTEDSSGAWCRRTCGGVNAYAPGTPVLHTLRDLCLLTGRQANDVDMYQEEFLSEFSLQVI